MIICARHVGKFYFQIHWYIQLWEFKPLLSIYMCFCWTQRCSFPWFIYYSFLTLRQLWCLSYPRPFHSQNHQHLVAQFAWNQLLKWRQPNVAMSSVKSVSLRQLKFSTNVLHVGGNLKRKTFSGSTFQILNNWTLCPWCRILWVCPLISWIIFFKVVISEYWNPVTFICFWIWVFVEIII